MGTIYASGQGSSYSSNFLKFNCISSDSVGKVVYLSNSISKTVVLAQADSIITSIVKGVIIKKPTQSTCLVQLSGNVNVFTGLIVGTVYYLSESVAGGIQSVRPISGVGNTLRIVGKAISETEMILDLDSNSIVLR